MRGKPAETSAAPVVRRFIPAHAGKTAWPSPPPTIPRVHPRACGENEEATKTAFILPGSSPRMRGKRLEAPDGVVAARFIPAHAGKTATTGTTVARSRVHPRACGENLCRLASDWYSPGSSPRMRGKRIAHELGAQPGGFIPAHAGKTGGGPRAHPGRRVHPRACGENGGRRRPSALSSGSSPRMRGKHAHEQWGRYPLRFIPAHAGKTRKTAFPA